jgi:hypothetical protein
MNHAKTEVSTEIFAGAMTSAAQYLAPQRYMNSALFPAALSVAAPNIEPR